MPKMTFHQYTVADDLYTSKYRANVKPSSTLLTVVLNCGV